MDLEILKFLEELEDVVDTVNIAAASAEAFGDLNASVTDTSAGEGESQAFSLSFALDFA
jgi:hypothetical protein